MQRSLAIFYGQCTSASPIWGKPWLSSPENAVSRLDNAGLCTNAAPQIDAGRAATSLSTWICKFLKFNHFLMAAQNQQVAASARFTVLSSVCPRDTHKVIHRAPTTSGKANQDKHLGPSDGAE